MATSSQNEVNHSDKIKKIIIGSIFIAVGAFIFATNDAIFKSSGYTESQLLIGRFGVQLILGISWWIIQKPSTVKNWYGDDPNILNIWVRGILFFCHTFSMWYSILFLPIGDATTIEFIAPVVIAILAGVWLKEALPVWYILIPTIICAVNGTILLAQPPFITTLFTNDTYQLNIKGLGFSFIAMITWAFVNLLIRKAKNSHFLQLEIVNSFQVIFFGLPILMVLNHYVLYDEQIGDVFSNNGGWKFDLKCIMTQIILGTLGFIALCCTVIGYQYAPATKVSWIEYLTIVMAMFYQTFLFNDPPNAYEIIGAVLIIIASITPLVYEICVSKNDQEENTTLTSDEQRQLLLSPDP